MYSGEAGHPRLEQNIDNMLKQKYIPTNKYLIKTVLLPILGVHINQKKSEKRIQKKIEKKSEKN
jgi:hypothetical protein